MRFEFATPTRVVFGAGTVHEVPALASELGTTVLLVTGCPEMIVERVRNGLEERGVRVDLLKVGHEPSVEGILLAVEALRRDRQELVIALGGGSALDTGKALAALATNPGDPYDYLEVVGRGKPLERPSLPFIAVPTTAGTGSEVTRNAVLASTTHGVKASLRSPLMFPRVAVVDPELTYSLPAARTATTGLDALAQLIEPFTSLGANVMTDPLCREGIRRSARSLLVAYRDGGNESARADLALASLWGGMALGNAGLGAAHGFAAPIGGMFPRASHAVLCAILLAPVMEANIAALRTRKGDTTFLARYAVVAALLTGNGGAEPEEGVAWLRKLTRQMNIPSLSEFGIAPSDFPEIIVRARKASSMRWNPVELTEEELIRVLENSGGLS